MFVSFSPPLPFANRQHVANAADQLFDVFVLVDACTLLDQTTARLYKRTTVAAALILRGDTSAFWE